MEVDVKAIFSKNLITISETASLAEAETLMSKNKIRHLPVTNQNSNIVGILSRTDFSALKHVEADTQKLKVKSFMTSPALAIANKTSVKTLVDIMMAKKISSVLVTDNNTIVGIVTTEDLLKLLAQNIDLIRTAEKIRVESMGPEGLLF